MRVLYISYDGLTDHIGQSQVLPYLLGCAHKGHEITVVSFEKPERLARLGDAVSAQCRDAGMTWQPQPFHSSPPILSKAYDMMAMQRAAQRIVERDGPFDLVHGRSYQASWVALGLKRRFGIPFLFDMRGFWVEQRRHGGRWKQGTLFGDLLYRQWKDREAAMLREADHVVVLAEAARNDVMARDSYGGEPVSVIPCCADFELFQLPTREQRSEARRKLGLADDGLVLAYLGSIGTVYRFDAHLRLFDHIRQQDKRGKMLVVGSAPMETIVSEATRAGIALSPSDLAAVACDRRDVPYWLAAGDVGTAFYTTESYSRGVSPTKMGEYLACGLPVISNDSVGDAAALLHELDAGASIPDFSDASIDRAAREFFRWANCDRDALRQRGRSMFDLPLAIKAYSMIYDSLTPLRLPTEGR